MDTIPESESLEDTVNRVSPFIKNTLINHLDSSESILIAAHGNSIRAILKITENISDTKISELEIPTGKPIFVKYDINETYAEIWARLILVGIASDIKTSDYNEFNKHFIQILGNEITFSIMQATKVLKYVNVMNKYKEYKENTNAYAYYVFTAALMNNYLEFIKWCYDNNENLFYFIKKDSNIRSFTDLIISSLNEESLQKKLTCLYFDNKTSNKTMRMTSLDIF